MPYLDTRPNSPKSFHEWIDGRWITTVRGWTMSKEEMDKAGIRTLSCGEFVSHIDEMIWLQLVEKTEQEAQEARTRQAKQFAAIGSFSYTITQNQTERAEGE